MKKRHLFLGAGIAALFVLGGAGAAQADNGPHVSDAATGASAIPKVVGTDGCAGCHRVHTAKSADGMLLKTTTQAQLCYTCHGNGAGGAATNVQGGVGYDSASRTGTAAALRGGGFETALINSSAPTVQYALGKYGLRPTAQSIPVLPVSALGLPSAATTSNHSIDGSEQTMWGNGAISATVDPVNAGKAGVSLACGSCHDPHGNKNFRILKSMPNDAEFEVTPEIPAVMDTTVVPATVITPAVPAVSNPAIAIPDQPVKEYTTSDYWQTGAVGVPKISGKTGDAITAKTPDGFIANISDWCLTCHTRYEGKSGAREADSGDAVFTYRHSTAKIDVVGTRNCITCHVAHGSNANMNGAESSKVELPDGTQAAQHLAGSASSRLLRVDNRGVCIMCHNV